MISAKRTSVSKILALYTDRMRTADRAIFCLQIGANDGKTNDPLFEYFSSRQWQGLLVEPLPDVFEQLKESYRDNSNVSLANVGVAPSNGTLPFYRVRLSKARWATGLSSFERTTLVKHFENGYIQRHAQMDGIEPPTTFDEAVEEIAIPTLTISSLLSQREVNKVDVICIDTEGFDLEIIKLIDFDSLAPDMIVFERKHLSPEKLDEADRLLASNGYQVMIDGGNAVALRRNFVLISVQEASRLAKPWYVRAWNRAIRIYKKRVRRARDVWEF